MTERFQWTFPIVIAPTDPNDALRHLAARLEVDQRRPELAADQPRPDAARSRRRWGRRAGRSRSTRPASRPTRRSSRSRRAPLDGNVIWAGSDDGLVHVTRDGGKNWAEGHAAGPAGVHAHQPDRGVAARRRHRVPRRQPLPARRPRAVRLQDHRLRQDLDEDRRPASRPTTSRARSARTRSAKACCSSAPRPASTCRSTTAARGSRCGCDLPVTPVHGIEVKDDDLVIGTHGRSFYILDNISCCGRSTRDDDQRAARAVRSGRRDALGVARRRRSTTT